MESRIIMIIARIMITPLFIYSGTGKIINFTDNVLKTPFGDSLIGRLMIIAAIIIEIGGSFAFLSGYKIKETSLLWILYVFLTSVMFHQFWAISGAQQRLADYPVYQKHEHLCGAVKLLSPQPG